MWWLHAEVQMSWYLYIHETKISGHNVTGESACGDRDENDIVQSRNSIMLPICYIVLWSQRRLSYHAVWAPAAATGFFIRRHRGNRWWFLKLRGREEHGESSEGVHLLYGFWIESRKTRRNCSEGRRRANERREKEWIITTFYTFVTVHGQGSRAKFACRYKVHRKHMVKSRSNCPGRRSTGLLTEPNSLGDRSSFVSISAQKQ